MTRDMIYDFNSFLFQLQTGYQCVKHYQKLHRSPVFSHEELICKMATIPDSLDLDIAKKVYLNMEDIVHKEIDKRKALHEAVSHLSIQGSHTYSEAQI